MPEAIRQGDVPGVQLRVRRRLAADAEETWGWLTEPRRMARWIGEAGGSERGSVVVESRDEDGRALRERLRVLERKTPERWVGTLERLDSGWKAATRLTFEVTPGPGRSEISVFQEGFAHLSLSTCLTEWEFYRRRWRWALDRLERALRD